MDLAVSSSLRAGAVSPGFLFSGFIAGVAMQLQQSSLWQGASYAVLAALAGALLGVLYRVTEKRNFRGAAWAVLLCAALLGFGVTGWRASAFQSTTLNPALEGRDIAVTGMVLAMPQPGEDAVRFRLGIETARLDGQPV